MFIGRKKNGTHIRPVSLQVLAGIKYLLLPEATVPTTLALSPLSAAPMRADPSSRQVGESQNLGSSISTPIWGSRGVCPLSQTFPVSLH